MAPVRGEGGELRSAIEIRNMNLQDRKEGISGGGELGSAREIRNMNLQERKERISGCAILQRRPQKLRTTLIET